MANELLTPAQISKDFYDAIKKAAKGDADLEREIYYHFYTLLGGFPDTTQARRDFGVKKGRKVF